MLGMGQDALDAWWALLLENRQRMEQLARSLQDAGGGSVSQDDLSAVVEALTLVENRLDELDGQVRTLTAGMAQIVELLERLGGDQDGGDD